MKVAVWSKARAIDPLVRSCIGARNLARVLRRCPSFAAALAIAVAGCAAAPAPAKPVATKDPCARVSAPAFPDAPESCVAPTEPAAVAGSCVPAYARGREIARDDALQMRVYEACLPEISTRAGSLVRVDPRRVIIERAGERPAREEELQVMVGTLGLDISTREPALATSPWVVDCREDIFNERVSCLALNLLAPRSGLSALMTALAKLMPLDPVCVPMKVEFGAPEGCPIETPVYIRMR